MDVQVNEQAVLAALEAQNSPQVTETPASEPVQVEESFTSLDPNTLPAEARPFYESMRADYTRKTQEIAAQRKAVEALGDFDTVKQQVEFYRRFDSDPEFAKQVVDSLTPKLQELFPVTPETPSTVTDDLDDYELPPALVQRLQGVEQQLAKAEEERQAMVLAGNIQRAEMAIAQDNPHYKESDFAKIRDLLYVTNGDVFKAQEWYEETRQQVLASYLSTKQEVPAGVQPVQTPTPHSQTPVTFDTVEGAVSAAVEYARARASGG